MSTDTPQMVFVSYAEEDSSLAREIVTGLEDAGYRAWHYERDSRPGTLYLREVGDAIERSQAVILLASPASLKSHQVTNEVVRAYECAKPFLPVLYNLTHAELQTQQPLWRQALGATTASEYSQGDPQKAIQHILSGLSAIGVLPQTSADYVGAAEQRERVGQLQKVLAVLPFDNLGSPEDEYFAHGMSDEIRLKLAALNGLDVISRTSSLSCKETDANIRKIGKRLGADYVLEGTVRWDKSQDRNSIRISAQLIDVTRDSHLWTHSYDAILNGVFSIQSEIAKKVAEALNVRLLESEPGTLTNHGPEYSEAYDCYLRANQCDHSTSEGRSTAEALYLRAIDLDPGFAQAFAYLGLLYSMMYRWDYGRSEERLLAAKEAIDKSLEISPNLPEAHFALGWYYFRTDLDCERALEQFDIARVNGLRNADILFSVGSIKRRQGQWNEAIQNLREASKLDPRELNVLLALAKSLTWTRAYDEAREILERCLAESPTFRPAYIEKSWLLLACVGEVNSARETVSVALKNIGRWPRLAFVEVWIEIIEGSYHKALDLLKRPAVMYLTTETGSVEYHLLIGDLYRYMEEISLSRQSYGFVKDFAEKRIAVYPNSALYRTYLARSCAGLGLKDESLRLCKIAADVMPTSKNAIEGTGILRWIAEAHLMVGEYDDALDLVEALLSKPSDYSAKFFASWPDYAVVRHNERFQQLLRQHLVET